MERQEPEGSAGSLTQEPPGGATWEVPGGTAGMEAGSGLPSGVVLPQGSRRSGVVTRSPDSFRHSGVVAAHGSRANQHPGEVAGHSLGSGTHPGGFNPPVPGTRASGTGSDFGTKGSGVHTSGYSPHSSSTSLRPHKRPEDQPHSILKNVNPTLVQQSPSEEKKKSQRWDEMNIMTTYHPADKDYGFMKVDEPSTPFHRPQDSDESSYAVNPEALAERLAAMDNFYPKVLQHPDNRSSGPSSDNFSKTHSSGFEKHRKAHYNEGKFLAAQESQPSRNNRSSGGSESLGSGGGGVMPGPESRPVEGGLAGGVKDDMGLVTRNHFRETEDCSTFRNQSSAPAAVVLPDKKADVQRKEYYIKGRYLRCSPHPEFEEDLEDEQPDRDGSTSLNRSSENSIRTEVRLLDLRGSSLRDHRPSSRTPQQ